MGELPEPPINNAISELVGVGWTAAVAEEQPAISTLAAPKLPKLVALPVEAIVM
jgi:hypothetical protein